MAARVEEEFPEIPRPGGTLAWIVLAVALAVAGFYLMLPAEPRAGARPVAAVTAAPEPSQPSAPIAGDTQQIRFAYVDSPDSTFALSVAALSRRVAELTRGRLRLEPLAGGWVDGKKYGELELIKMIQSGELDMGLSTTSPLTNFNPSVAVLDLPYLFADSEQADRVLDGPEGRALLAGLEPHGLVGLGFFEVGFRIFSCAEPMPDLEAFEGRRVRVMESATYINFIKALDGEPVPSPVDKIYEMGRQGLIDAADRSYPTYWDFKLYEVHRFVTETRHSYSTKAVLANRELYEALSEEDRAALATAVRENEAAHRARQRAEEARVKQKCLDEKIQITELTPEERARFVERCGPLYEEFGRLHSPELVRRFRDG